ncbi:mCG142120, isoform CRA_a [Mus musculus]|nr:mCG142120, isoform CRA_a [Mus musculus]
MKQVHKWLLRTRSAQGKDAPAVFAESQGSSEAENTSGPDVDMNSQVDGVNEPTESLQEDLQ